jgi:hypothetical protein
MRGYLLLDCAGRPRDDFKRFARHGDQVVDMLGVDARIAIGHWEQIVNFRNYRLSTGDGVGQVVDHQRKVESIAVGGQLQEDDIDGKPAASHEVWQCRVVDRQHIEGADVLKASVRDRATERDDMHARGEARRVN